MGLWTQMSEHFCKPVGSVLLCLAAVIRQVLLWRAGAETAGTARPELSTSEAAEKLQNQTSTYPELGGWASLSATMG